MWVTTRAAVVVAVTLFLEEEEVPLTQRAAAAAPVRVEGVKFNLEVVPPPPTHLRPPCGLLLGRDCCTTRPRLAPLLLLLPLLLDWCQLHHHRKAAAMILRCLNRTRGTTPFPNHTLSSRRSRQRITPWQDGVHTT